MRTAAALALTCSLVAGCHAAESHSRAKVSGDAGLDAAVEIKDGAAAHPANHDAAVDDAGQHDGGQHDAGYACTSPIVCAGDCTYEPLADLAVRCASTYGGDLREGICGAYRYRVSTETIDGGNHWKIYRRSNGALVADSLIFGDGDDACDEPPYGWVYGDVKVLIDCMAARDAGPQPVNLCDTLDDAGSSGEDGG
jgi:hypothetical protein